MIRSASRSSLFLILALAQTAASVAYAQTPAPRCERLLLAADPVNAARLDHPFTPVMLQVLPALLQAPIDHPGQKPLQTLHDQLPSLKGFAGDLFLGPVYPQSVAFQMNEQTGALYKNTGYYWIASFNGVDPDLGTHDDYIALAEEARRDGINVVQDIAMNYMGYLPQKNQPVAAEQLEHYRKTLESLGISTEGVDLRENYYLWGKWVNYRDTGYFTHGTGSGDDWGIPQWAFDVAESDNPDPARLAEARRLIQTSDLYGLHALNKENPKVLDGIINDHLWYIRDAKVSRFRIDAAKHMDPAVLKEILRRFNAEVKNTLGPDTQPEYFLEYWSTKYSQFAQFKKELGDESRGVYFFDYPLTQTIRSAVLHGLDLRELGGLIDKRNASGIKLRELVSLYSDHDFSFPTYDGSEKAVGQLAAGTWLSYMMGGNSPHVYNGFEKTSFYRDPNGQNNEPARNPYPTVLDRGSKAFQVVKSIIDTASAPDVREIFARSEDIHVRDAGADHIVLERGLGDSKKKITLKLARNGADPGREKNGRLVWEYVTRDLSLRVYYDSW